MSSDPETATDLQLALSQWIGVGEIVKLMQKVAKIERDEALIALRLRGLGDVRPAVLDVLEQEIPLTNNNDRYTQGCVDKVLTPH